MRSCEYTKTSGTRKTKLLQLKHIRFFRKGTIIPHTDSNLPECDCVSITGAMAMYLNGVPVFTIMLIGRWKSDGVLRYIRKQVLQLSNGVSTRMLKHADYWTVPDFSSQMTPTVPGNQQVQRGFNGRGASRTSFQSPLHLQF